MEQKKIVLGYKGEIGNAIKKIFKSNIGIDINKCEINNIEYDLNESNKIKWNNYECILHITIPFTDNYIDIVEKQIKKINPKLTLIHTTCASGTTRKLFEKTKLPIVHVPINGKHPDVIDDIKNYTLFVGSIKESHGQMACEYIEWHGLKTYLCESPEITELSKIASTELIRVNIEFYQQMKEKIKEKNLNWAEFIAFMEKILVDNPKYKVVYQRAGEIDTSFSKKHCIKNNEKIFREYS